MPKTNLSKPRDPSASPVSLLPDPQTPDLSDLLADRLTEDLLNEIDLKVLSGKVFKTLVKKFKNRFTEFLRASNDNYLPLNEIDAQTVDIDSKVA